MFVMDIIIGKSRITSVVVTEEDKRSILFVVAPGFDS
jgi:hypothetical protein